MATGASRGIGKGIAIALGEPGATVYVAGWHAAGPGAAILNVSSPDGPHYHSSSSYTAGKATFDHLMANMAIELQPKGIAAVVLDPGAVSTEFIRDAASIRKMDLSTVQSPQFVGRAAAALLANHDLMGRSGTIQWVDDLAEEFDITNEDGSRPPPYPQRAR